MEPQRRRTVAHDKNAAFDGIVLQEFDPEQGKLVGEITNIFKGSAHGLTEAPHFFKRGDYYYLTTAEGGTGYEHAVTLARAKSIAGPYELHPQKHVMTAMGQPHSKLQRVGHGQLVEAPNGDVFHTFLMGRPLNSSGNQRSCPLGRETGLAKCEWRDDGWLYLQNGSQLPDEEFNAPWTSEVQNPDAKLTYEFSGKLPEDFQWLRTPEPERIFEVGDGYLRLVGRESVGSWFEQSLVARRQTHFQFHASATLLFEADDYQQNAGLIAYYNRHKFHFLAVSRDPDLGRVLTILSCDGDWPECQLSFPLETDLPIEAGEIELGLSIEFDQLQFLWRPVGGNWQKIGPILDAAVLSDEGGRGEHASFTGNFIGMAAFDTSAALRRQIFFNLPMIPLWNNRFGSCIMANNMKGPGIFLAQFLGDEAPFNSLDGLTKWASSLGYKGVQIPVWDKRVFDLDKAASSQSYCDEIKGLCAENGVEITELSTHMLGQLVAVHPAYDQQFDGLVPAEVQNNPNARQKWAVDGVMKTAKASRNLGLDVTVSFTGSLAFPYIYPWPQRPDGLIEEAFGELAKRWHPIFDAYEEQGVDIGFELHPGEDVFDGITFEMFLEKVNDHKRCTINYDPSHFVLQQLDYLDFIDIYHERITAFHVKDAEFNPSGRQGVYSGYQPG